MSHRYQQQKEDWAKDLDSWFDECVMDLPYLIKKFGTADNEIDPNPKVTEALIKQYNKRQGRIIGGIDVLDADKKYFIRAAKTVVDFHQQHKKKINWGGRLAESRCPIKFAWMMIDARFHFSEDNVTMVKPTWFSSEAAPGILVDFLLARGLINASSKKSILARMS